MEASENMPSPLLWQIGQSLVDRDDKSSCDSHNVSQNTDNSPAPALEYFLNAKYFDIQVITVITYSLALFPIS